MLGTEVARLINPKVERLIRHLPAVAAVSATEARLPERALYLALVQDQYPESACKDIALALDYEQFWLRFNDGREIVKDILNLTGNTERHPGLLPSCGGGKHHDRRPDECLYAPCCPQSP